MRAIGYTVAWCGATALAVGVAWFGVSGVLRTALGDGEPLTPLVVAAPQPNVVSGVRREPPSPEAAVPPSEPPASIQVTPTAAAATPRPRKTPAATRRPTVTATTSEPKPTPPPAPKQSQAPQPSPSAQSQAAQSEEKLHTFNLNGGRATVAVREKDCRIVSATPAEGWELQTWTEPYWLRITFLRDGKESSAFCTWNALPPRLDTYET
ncbi:hypothetical protein [Herbidospora mongoliensis]|uniref:hypothetical protein n=1 Tax=Herbidospora mongoliensis TaxID=688067 RepID=UPI0008311DBB|nr:hypothetical protein [Herbidospora mongoliensis]